MQLKRHKFDIQVNLGCVMAVSSDSYAFNGDAESDETNLYSNIALQMNFLLGWIINCYIDFIYL